MTQTNEEEMQALQAGLTVMFDGKKLEAVLYSCASIMAHAYLQIPPHHRRHLRSCVERFIDRTIEDLETCDQRPN